MLKNLLRIVARNVILAICLWTTFVSNYYLWTILQPVLQNWFWQGLLLGALFVFCISPYAVAENKLKISYSANKIWTSRIADLLLSICIAIGFLNLLKKFVPLQMSFGPSGNSWQILASILLGSVIAGLSLSSIFYLYRNLHLRAQK